MSRRTEMIGSTLKQELMSIIMRQLNDPRLEGMPSITRVKVASDLSTADVFVTIMGTPGKQTAALNALISSAGVMRQKLKKSLPLRTIPMLKFHIDEALRKELNVLELIDKAVKEENELHPQPESTETTDEATSEEATTDAETNDNALT
ncbi:MAG: rbfA, partial [Phycisphaerales bacterium]|nr:rbfA [Phycisphaerales bacterium]